MLKDDFYSCQQMAGGDSEISCKLVFNGDHAIFAGHFPGNPVVPGVCMMEIVKELIQEQVGQKLIMRTTGNVKFLQIIKPDVQPTIVISWKEKDGRYVAKAIIDMDKAPMFKFDGAFEVVNAAD
jgi:3-hydroxyacyl-[acyl-carrier-protein] dehydratase